MIKPKFIDLSAKLIASTFLILLGSALLVRHGRAQEAKPAAPAAAEASDEKLDPNWGEDHVGKKLPDYVTGDECLFCHRNDIGPTWDKNLHGRTIRFSDTDKAPITEIEKNPALKPFASESEFIVGRNNRVRFIKKSKTFGQFEMATFSLVPAHAGTPAKVLNAENPSWDKDTFAKSCVGCHATAVESESMAMGAFALDCFACHGSVTLNHTNDTRLMHLSKKRGDKPNIVASICGQCHLREGKSKSTGRPYANQFVGGDNLFKDYQADFSDKFIDSLNPGDRHIYHNIRDIVANNVGRVTCLSCHSVHQNSSAIHTAIPESKLCADCHAPGEPKNKPIAYVVHSKVCDY